MKKLYFFLIMLLSFITLMGCDELFIPTARQIAENSQKEMANAASISVPIPQVSYFQEKRTIAKWAERWDKPNMPAYVYLVSFGQILGYYVTDGKPASTRSYLMPEENVLNDPHGSLDAGSLLVSAPDIDGTYGDNNPGIRFFTAEGTAVEWAGVGACYIYSDVPLPLKVPNLNTQA